ncbi:hypothetical protein TorRG33x02_118520, partial [Trema orientale]
MSYMSKPLSTLLPGFRMPVRQTPGTLAVPPMPLPPVLPLRYRSQPSLPPSEPKEDKDATNL